MNAHTLFYFFRAQDLRGTCLLDTRCVCSDAEKQLKIGEISCQGGPLVNRCPEDCEVCKFCLGVVLRDYCDSTTSRPSGVPSWLPSDAPIIIPSSMPSSLPTSRPSSLPSSGPTQSFDLSQCQEYEIQW